VEFLYVMQMPAGSFLAEIDMSNSVPSMPSRAIRVYCMHMTTVIQNILRAGTFF